MNDNQEELNNTKIEIGNDLEDFLLTPTGTFFIKLLDQKISYICYDAILGKTSKGDRKGKYNSQTIEEFMLNRGFALGIQWVIDDIKSRINTAKRLMEEKKAQEEIDNEQP